MTLDCFSRFLRQVSAITALVAVVGTAVVPATAQQAPTTPPAAAPSAAPSAASAAAFPALSAAQPAAGREIDYSKPRGQVPNLVGPYIPRHVPEPILANTSRIDSLLRNGKIYLSLNDAIALSLENNLDVAIARYNLAIADTDLLRTRAGATARGVATGLVQGTPGGGVGGLGEGASGAGAGGTSGGAGGAGSGASGIVSSTLGAGTQVDSFDPFLSANLTIEHASSPLSNTVTTGVASLLQNIGQANFTYGQAFSTGSSFSVAYQNSRSTTNSLFSTLVPQINSAFRVSVRQHLLAGCCLLPNRRFIRIAKNNREISDVSFRNQVIATVSQIQNIYWDLVSAYEDASVKDRSLALAQKTLSDNQAQVKLGAMAPIEVTRAQSDVATRQQDLIVAKSQLLLQQLLMKNAITRNMSDAGLVDAQVVPTDSMDVPQQEPVVPIQELISDALSHRPELAQARIDMTNREISRKAGANALLPQVDFIGWYGGSSLAGEQNPLNSNLKPGTVPRTGFGNAFSSLMNGKAPDYAVGFNVEIPIRNRAAQADQIRSELEYRQAQMRLQQLQNQIRIEVRNAQYALEQNRGRVDAARLARDLAQHSYDIEQKKYTLGASTNVAVLQAQRDLAVAESNLVSANSAYEKSRVELDRVIGVTLSRYGIDIEEAERGEVQHMPNVPGVKPRENPQPEQNQPR